MVAFDLCEIDAVCHAIHRSDYLSLGQHETTIIPRMPERTCGIHRQVTVALLGPDRVLGLSSAIGDNDPLIGATTLVPTHVCFATWPKMTEVFVPHPSVMLRLTSALTEQVFRAETGAKRILTTAVAAAREQ